ncbi:efflux RND transporter permease subunit, partial [Salmonella enterica]|uniref:efflux RND transporter permease subunit n=1 Tax=Salmonella enterica TaxID=28901 RepID=UPI003D2CF643
KVPHGEHKESKVFGFISRTYRPILFFGINHRAIVVTGTTTIALIAAFLFTRLGSDFIPQLDEGDIVLGLVRDTSISLDKSVDEQRKAEKI